MFIFIDFLLDVRKTYQIAF